MGVTFIDQLLLRRTNLLNMRCCCLIYGRVIALKNADGFFRTGKNQSTSLFIPQTHLCDCNRSQNDILPQAQESIYFISNNTQS